MPTQQEIANHLGLSQQAVSKQLAKMQITDWQKMSMDEIRLAYIERLRQSASGQDAEFRELRLTREKIENERSLIALKKEKGELVDIAELIPVLKTLFSGFKERLNALPAFIRSDVYVTTGKEVDENVYIEKCEEILQNCYEYVNSYSSSIEDSWEGGKASG